MNVLRIRLPTGGLCGDAHGGVWVGLVGDSIWYRMWSGFIRTAPKRRILAQRSELSQSMYLH